jgi:predicted TIM-barrel fold metal-dependent hydrolase
MWIRQSDLDVDRAERSPVPLRIASNEEFVPPPQSREQRMVELELWALAERAAAKLGVSRRDFLRSSCGLAAALVAMNRVFGPCYAVEEDEVFDAAKVREKWPKDQFIFDIQTHHVDVAHKWYEDTPDGRAVMQFFKLLRGKEKFEDNLETLNRDHYIKEIFFDSDTVMAVISGVPTRDWSKNPLPPDQMAATRDRVNQLARSQRVLAHGLLRPNLGASELEEAERQVKELKISAWKMYTGAELGEQAWWMSDEKVAYPFWEKTLELGVKNLCVHKGLPLGLFNEEHCRPKDLLEAAQDWPQLNFIVYHSAFRGFAGNGKLAGKQTDNPQEIPWTSDLLADLEAHPEVKNIYFELGSTFGQISAYAPETCMHLLGQMVKVAGADRILWGTDSIWGGSPQSQIERLRRLQISDALQEKYGYAPLTGEVKAKILGLNAARLFGLDVAEKRHAIEHDRFSQLKREYDRNPRPSNTQYGWVWEEDGGEPTVPVGPG